MAFDLDHTGRRDHIRTLRELRDRGVSPLGCLIVLILCLMPLFLL